MRTTSVASFLLLLATLTATGCTANQPFRTNFDAATGDPARAVIEATDEYKLGFVEFDDQGYFWCPRQRTVVEQMVREEAGLPTTRPTTRTATTRPIAANGILLVAFAHGWKENAAHDGDGVVAFRAILKRLSLAERAQTDHAPRKVVGVYLGWRGLSATWEPFKELTFWTRKSTAHKVGGYGAMTELLIDLENIQRHNLANLPPDAPRSEFIVIGHSFGGGAVFSAIAQIITERFADTIPNGHRLKPLGDQVILLNPAFEALRYYDLQEMAAAAADTGGYPDNQRPVLSIFTSKGDWATHYAFPVGRSFSTAFEQNRDHDQKQAGLQAVGWFKAFKTHDLIYTPCAATAATQPSAPAAAIRPVARTDKAEKRLIPPTPAQMQQSVANVKTQRDKWKPNRPRPETYTFDNTTLKPCDTYRAGNPFLVVSVDTHIMSGHNDITNPALIDFLRDYIQFCQNETKE